MAGVVFDIVCDDQIEPAIAVEVEETCRSSPEQAFQAGGAADVAEFPFAEIFEQSQFAELGDADVGEAVVIHIADGDTGAEARHVETGTGAYVAKGSIRLLMIQAVG